MIDKAATTLLTGLPPILPQQPRLLILGSMPSARSLTEQQYYAHPQNAFWTIILNLLNATPSKDYAANVNTIKRANIAVWDVLATCCRTGSLDSAIIRQSESPNNIAKLLNQYPSILAIALNGGRAKQCFCRHVAPVKITVLPLPSTSPANARTTILQKTAAWQQILPFIQPPHS